MYCNGIYFYWLMTLQITPLFINTTMKYNLLFFQYSKTKSADHGYIEILLNTHLTKTLANSGSPKFIRLSLR
jgi:hypothetical protein